MKALTIWQPWASLIIGGAKPYEFRGWRPPASLIGQRIVIHAGAAMRPRDEIQQLALICEYRKSEVAARYWAETCLIAEMAEPILAKAMARELPMSAGIGTAIVGEPRLGTEIAEEFGVPRANDSDRDQHANWGWPMLEIEAWPEPIPMRGFQGLWTWQNPADVIGGQAHG